MKRRITRISVETEREVIVVGGDLISDAWCPQCGKPVVLIEQKEADAASGFNSRVAKPLVKPDNRHLVEVVEGRILICPNSQQD